MLLSCEKEIERQLELLTRAFPGRLVLPIEVACNAVGIAKKTYFNRRLERRAPFPARRQGGKLVVFIEDLARAAADLYASGDAQIDERRRDLGRLGAAASKQPGRGRPTNEERAAAAAAGLTVRELRARRAGGAS